MGSNFLLSVILLEKVLISQTFIEPSTLVLTCSRSQASAAPSLGTAVKLAGGQSGSRACHLARLEWESKKVAGQTQAAPATAVGAFAGPTPLQGGTCQPTRSASEATGVPVCSPRKELYVCSVTGGQRGVGTAPPSLGSL